MSFTFSGGTQVISTNKIEVKTGVTCKHQQTTLGSNGISIKVNGTHESHVLQLVYRMLKSYECFTKGEYLTLAYQIGPRASYQEKMHHLVLKPVKKDDRPAHVDSLSRTSPFFDMQIGVPEEKNGGVLTIWDEPTMTERDTNLAMRTARDISKFMAWAFCLADGGLVGVVEWRRKQTGNKGTPTYYNVRLLDPSEIQAALA